VHLLLQRAGCRCVADVQVVRHALQLKDVVLLLIRGALLVVIACSSSSSSSSKESAAAAPSALNTRQSMQRKSPLNTDRRRSAKAHC
jgi:hypothetical protein